MTRTMKVNRFAGEGGDEYELRHPWPEDCFVQGGRNGIVLGPKGYQTAFFEAFPTGTFIRGEGETVEDAEAACWVKYKLSDDCPGHEWRPYPKGQPDHPYTNGAGFCQRCNRFESNVFTGRELGQSCAVCGIGTTWASYGPEAYWDDDSFTGVRDPSPKETKVWYCETDSPFSEERHARRERELDEMRGQE